MEYSNMLHRIHRQGADSVDAQFIHGPFSFHKSPSRIPSRGGEQGLNLQRWIFPVWDRIPHWGRDEFWHNAVELRHGEVISTRSAARTSMVRPIPASQAKYTLA